MWILPKQLHTSDFVPDIAALNLDSNESSQLCAQSLFVRSKPSPVQTWLRKWKRDSWTRLLFGRILNPSHGQTFVEKWTSSLADTHVSHLAPPEIDSAKTIPGTYGRLLQTEFDFSSPESVSLKTSMDTSVLDSEKLSKNWKDLVTKRRGEYLARAKLGRPTKENGSSSWPTATTADGGKIGCQPNFGQVCLSNHPAIVGLPQREKLQKSRKDEPMSWPTPTAGEHLDQGTNWDTLARLDKGGRILRRIATLHGQQAQAPASTIGNPPESWPTPRAEMDSEAHRGNPDTLHSLMKTQANGKLNPRWVETLMNVPIGWTMPSCTSPVTIVPTNSDCLGTE